MLNLCKEEEEGVGSIHPKETDLQNAQELERLKTKIVYIHDEQLIKYNHLLEVLSKEFCLTDFMDYCPTKVINRFWSKYNMNDTDRFNLFDMILLAQGAVPHKSTDATMLNDFLRDFLGYMIASHTVHYMNRSYSAIGRHMRPDQVDEIKEGVRIDFVSRLSGLK